jgi:hypothetical protein
MERNDATHVFIAPIFSVSPMRADAFGEIFAPMGSSSAAAAAAGAAAGTADVVVAELDARRRSGRHARLSLIIQACSRQFVLR